MTGSDPLYLPVGIEPAQRIYRPVGTLHPEVARKIAAGEVIDRPAACVRELVDNAIDSGATRVLVEIWNGGIERIRVVDDGTGMSAEDLAICAKTHTTSKISSEDDLLSLGTLGFRGEALASIDAVSRLEITSARDGIAHRLSLGKVAPATLRSGTIVLVEGLFENFPARRQFLKRASAESALCRQVFVDKALAWPGVEFRLSVDGSERLILPRATSFRERVLASLAPDDADTFVHEIAGSGDGFSFILVLGSPDLVRQDRRDMLVFVNGRRISEYSLVQAIEYGAEGHFPNGGHPLAALFVAVDPARVDFNIHPAKREARFRDPGAIHRAVSSAARDFYRRYAIASVARDAGEDALLFDREERTFDAPPLYGSTASASPTAGSLAATALARQDIASAPDATRRASEIRLVGQALGTFIAVERDDDLYLIDQHAAHERILFEEFLSRAGETQELLVPYRVTTDGADEDARIAATLDELARAGFSVSEDGPGSWVVTAVPARWTGTERELSEEIRKAAAAGGDVARRLYATAACRAACKDGDVLDQDAALEIARLAFALPEPVCPHGRPIWARLSRESLFAAVKRT